MGRTMQTAKKSRKRPPKRPALVSQSSPEESPVKKGRGRPKKNVSSEQVKRMVGEPPGSAMSNATPKSRSNTPNVSGSQKKRGRPKMARDEEEELPEEVDEVNTSLTSEASQPTPKGKRGRPKVVRATKSDEDESGDEEHEEPESRPKKKAGRPKKAEVVKLSVESDSEQSDASSVLDTGDSEEPDWKPTKKAGRPKKEKSRGRPKKVELPLIQEPVNLESGDEEPVDRPKKGRGRPKKNLPADSQMDQPEYPIFDEEPEENAESEPEPEPEEPQTRKRGRPKKVKQPVASKRVRTENSDVVSVQNQKDVDQEAEEKPDTDVEQVKRKRGRPKMAEKSVVKSGKPLEPSAPQTKKRGRGRPPSKKTQADEDIADVAEQDDEDIADVAGQDDEDIADVTEQAQLLDVSTDTTSSNNITNKGASIEEEEDDDEISILDTPKQSPNKSKKTKIIHNRPISPPTDTLPDQILEEEESDEEKEEEEEEEEEDNNEEKGDEKNEKKDDSDDDAAEGGAGNGGGANTDDSGHDGYYDAGEEDGGAEKDQHKQNRTSSGTSRHSNRLAFEMSRMNESSQLSDSLRQMQKHWSNLVSKLPVKQLLNYKIQLQRMLTGRVSVLKNIDSLVPGFPSTLLADHDKLYSLLCEVSGAYPFKNYEGTTLVSRFWLADNTKIAAQIVLELLSKGISPLDVLKEPFIFEHIQDVVRIGIKDMLDEARSLLPKKENSIRTEHIPLSLTARLLTV